MGDDFLRCSDVDLFALRVYGLGGATMTQYGALAALGAGANALLYCLLKSFSMVDASALAPFRYTELILSAGVGWVLFKEAISMNTILGAMVIVPSVYVVWKENQKKE